VEVFVRNELPVGTTIHWHGMLSSKYMWRRN
jgi:FtsP/CotA-like multicopper oxidase with cupredoxin domain